MSEAKPQQFATLAVHAGQSPDPTTGSRAVPIYQTTSYLFQDADHAGRLFALQEFGNIYTRIMNPTTDVFEKRVAALEGGAAALATASGQAAETLTMTTLAARRRRDRLHDLPLWRHLQPLPLHAAAPWASPCASSMPTTSTALRAAINDKTRAIYTETLGNPKLDVADIEKLAAIAHEHGLPLVIDNTSPIAGAGAAHRVGRGHRRQLGHQVPRRSRHQHRRSHRGRRQVRLGRLRALQGFH